MFDAIAPTYERINTLFSFGRDRAWRRRAVRLSRVRIGEAVLDIACGTGDLLRAFDRGRRVAERTRQQDARHAQPSLLVGVDFAHQMLRRAQRSSLNALCWCEGDALQLPFADASFDVASCAFGVRNFQSLDAGLTEMHRVLRRGGRAVILEFTRPSNRLIRAIHEFYSGSVMPRAAGLLSRDRTGAYRYLPQSVVSFVDAARMCARLGAAGFAKTTATPMTFGVVTIYVGEKE
jgi:demethylmenaquinone methyltransferase/2-methoxy-6-polyprenyl-1,4-benzoquinol methylase